MAGKRAGYFIMRYRLLAKLRLKPTRLKTFSPELRDAGYWMLDKKNKFLQLPASRNEHPASISRKLNTIVKFLGYKVRLVIRETSILKALLLISLIAFMGCATGGISVNPADNKKAAEILKEYIIQPGDSLLIDIIENNTISRTVVVRPDGKISLPQLNDIHAAGITAHQLRENLLKVYQQFYNVVEVTVTVANSTGYRITVIGEVNNPGQIILHDKTTFLEAIALAGGLSDWAKSKKIYIMREIDGFIGEVYGDKKKLNVNYNNILKGKEQDIWILPGDLIVVP
ncbi:MAG: polysaccharide biosynthesis/export family protein [bacterium]